MAGASTPKYYLQSLDDAIKDIEAFSDPKTPTAGEIPQLGAEEKRTDPTPSLLEPVAPPEYDAPTWDDFLKKILAINQLPVLDKGPTLDTGPRGKVGIANSGVIWARHMSMTALRAKEQAQAVAKEASIARDLGDYCATQVKYIMNHPDVIHAFAVEHGSNLPDYAKEADQLAKYQKEGGSYPAEAVEKDALGAKSAVYDSQAQPAPDARNGADDDPTNFMTLETLQLPFRCDHLVLLPPMPEPPRRMCRSASGDAKGGRPTQRRRVRDGRLVAGRAAAEASAFAAAAVCAKLLAVPGAHVQRVTPWRCPATFL